MRDQSEHVLKHLADQVGEAAKATAQDVRGLKQLAEGHRTYVGAIRSLLTGNPLPDYPNPSPGGPISLSQELATSLVSNLGRNVAGAAGELAKRGNARADELEAIRKKEEEEKRSGSGDRSGGSSSNGESFADQPQGTVPRGSDGGSTSSPEGTSQPGQPTGGTGPATTPGEPVQPESPTGETPKPTPRRPPKVEVRRKRVRRCFQFSIVNATNRQVSDLDFPVAGVDVSDFTGPQGWNGGSYSDGSGFGFVTTNRVLPGGRIGPLQFCIDEKRLRTQAFFSHPDRGPLTPITGEHIRVNGRRIPFKNGQPVIPTAKRSYVYDIEIDTGSGSTGNLEIPVKGGKIVDNNVTSGGEIAAGSVQDQLVLFGIGGKLVPADRTVQMTVVTSGPNTKFG